MYILHGMASGWVVLTRSSKPKKVTNLDKSHGNHQEPILRPNKFAQMKWLWNMAAFVGFPSLPPDLQWPGKKQTLFLAEFEGTTIKENHRWRSGLLCHFGDCLGKGGRHRRRNMPREPNDYGKFGNLCSMQPQIVANTQHNTPAGKKATHLLKTGSWDFQLDKPPLGFPFGGKVQCLKYLPIVVVS